MLFCFGLFALLLYNTVVANAVCSFTYSKKDRIQALSLDYQKQGYEHCEYVVYAPEDSYIELNFTDLIGFQSSQGPTHSPDPNLHYKRNFTSLPSSSTLLLSSSPPSSLSSTSSSFTASAKAEHTCLPPELIIRAKSVDGHLNISDTICKTKNYRTPLVFHVNSSSLHILYIWEHNQYSGFSVDIDFHQKSSNCEFHCDDSSCLPSNTLVCNQEYNCADRSDESNCSLLRSDGAYQSITTIVVIVIVVVFMPVLAVFICVVTSCGSTSRMWRRLRNREGRGVDHRQLRPRSQGSEVVSIPTTTSSSNSTAQDHLEQQIALLRERHTLMQSARTGMELGMPPQIQISADGEEGYVESQNKLGSHPKQEIYHTCFRPPPNKTVFDRDSPPSYYSCSVAPVNSLGHQHTKPYSGQQSVHDSNGSVIQCYNVNEQHSHQAGGKNAFLRQPPPPYRTSNNNSNHSGGHGVLQHQHTGGHGATEVGRDTAGLGLDRPPEYRADELGSQSRQVNVYNSNKTSPREGQI